MIAWVALPLTLAGAILLVVSGVGHVLRRRRFNAVLLTHDLPALVRRAVAVGLGPAEIVVGSALLAAQLSGSPVRWPAAAVAALYCGFVGYLARLLRRTPGVACGCLGDDESAGPAAIARAVGLGVAACAVVALPPTVEPLPTRAGVLAAAVVAALVIDTATRLASAPVAQASWRRAVAGLRLPSLAGGSSRVVLVAEAGCPLCRVVLSRLAERSGRLPLPPVLVTHEPPTAWSGLPAGVQFVRDDDAWRALVRLAPPVLLHLAADGTITDVAVLARASDVDTALARFAAG